MSSRAQVRVADVPSWIPPDIIQRLQDVKELMAAKWSSVKTVMDERHALYQERAQSQKVAVDDALKAQKELTTQAFSASEKAIVKAEDAQKAYNLSHNDLLKKMDLLVPKAEAQLKWETTDKEVQENRRELGMMREMIPRELGILRQDLMREIAGLRESRSEGTGERISRGLTQQRQQWSIGVVIAVAGLALSAFGAAMAIVFFVLTRLLPAH